MTNLEVMEALINQGSDVRIATVKAVRDGQDVKLVTVAIDNIAVDALTFGDALAAALASYRKKVQQRSDRDDQLLALLPPLT